MTKVSNRVWGRVYTCEGERVGNNWEVYST